MENTNHRSGTWALTRKTILLLVPVISIVMAGHAQVLLNHHKLWQGYTLYSLTFIPLILFLILVKWQLPSITGIGRNLEIFLFMVILFTGMFLRLHRINQLPPGLWFDEAENAFEAVRILKGGYYPVYTASSYSKETLYLYLVSFFFKFFGESPTSLRLASVFLGVLTIPVMYLFLKYMFGVRVALVSTALFATSSWHIFFSRIGFRAILMVPVLVLAVYYLFKASDSGKKKHFIISGIFLGLGLYTYIPFRIVPLIFLAYFLYLGIYSSIKHKRNKTVLDFSMKRYCTNVLFLYATAIVVLIPFIISFCDNPETFTRRTNQVSIFEHHQGKDLENILVKNICIYLNMFNVRGDKLLRHNYPGNPALTFMMSITATPGFILLLLGIWKPRNFFLTLWFITMLSFGIFTINPPNFLRTIGVLPFVIVCTGYFFRVLFQGINVVFKKYDWVLVYPTLIILLAGNGYETFNIYFKKYPLHGKLYKQFCYGEWAMAEYVKSFPGDRICYVSFKKYSTSFRFLVRNLGRKIINLSMSARDIFPIHHPVEKDLLFMVEPPNEKEYFMYLREFYPWGDYKTLKTPTSQIVAYTCALTREQVNQVFGLNVTLYSYENDGVKKTLDSFQVKSFTDKTLNHRVQRPGKLGIEYQACLFIPESGEYRFRLLPGKNCLMEVDNISIFPGKLQESTKSFFFQKGLHRFKLLVMIEGGDNPLFHMEYSRDGQRFKGISRDNFYTVIPSNPGVYAQPVTISNVFFKVKRIIRFGEQVKSLKSIASIAVNQQEEIFFVNNIEHQVLKFSSNGKLFKIIGGKGKTTGKFINPSSLVTGIQGKLYIADTMNHRVQVFNGEGDYLDTIAYRFWVPRGLALDSNHRLVVANTGVKNIRVFDRNGKHVLHFGGYGSDDGKFLFPISVTVDNNDNIYVLDGERQDVQVFSKNGKFIRKWNVELAKKHGIIVFTGDNIVILLESGGKEPVLYTLDGKRLHGDIFPGYRFHSPKVMAFDNQKQLYVLDNKEIIVFNMSEKPLDS